MDDDDDDYRDDDFKRDSSTFLWILPVHSQFNYNTMQYLLNHTRNHESGTSSYEL